MSKAKWAGGAPTMSTDAAGTIIASVPLQDGGVLAVTIKLTMTTGHGLRIDVTSEAGPNGLTSLECWSNT